MSDRLLKAHAQNGLFELPSESDSLLHGATDIFAFFEKTTGRILASFF